jgi:hypothetical protein
VERAVEELGDVMLSVIMKVNAPMAVGSSALLGTRWLNSQLIVISFFLSPKR